MKTKNIKVLYSNRSCSTGYLNSRNTMFPKIQMEGKWLETLGFHVGDKLQVDYEEGTIHIRLADMAPSMICEPENSYSTDTKGKK